MLWVTSECEVTGHHPHIQFSILNSNRSFTELRGAAIEMNRIQPQNSESTNRTDPLAALHAKLQHIVATKTQGSGHAAWGRNKSKPAVWDERPRLPVDAFRLAFRLKAESHGESESMGTT